jgi:hypothetical protein
MMRSHGIAPNAATIKPPPSRAPKAERRESNTASSSSISSKKRKAEQFLEENNGVDDDEGFGSSIKSEGVHIKEQLYVKEEEQHRSQLSLDEAADLMQYYDAPSSQYGGAQLSGEDIYGSSEYGGGSPAGYATPVGGSYSMQSKQGFDFGAVYDAAGGSPYGSAGMGSLARPESQGMRYQPLMRYSSDSQGRLDSPLVVE